jgi:predicted dehydrogenase
MGAHHARVFTQLGGCRLVGIHDIDPARAAVVSREHATESFESLDALLEKVDAVTVAVPTPDHHQIALVCLDAGCDVLIEKPMTSSLEEADELIAAAESRGRVLGVGHIERYNPAVEALADLVCDPGFIEVDRLGSFAPRSLETDVILDLMIHDIDVVHSLVDSDLSEIRAVGVPILSEALDIANARLEFDGGCIVNLTASRVSANRVRKVRIFQPEAYISVDYTAQSVDHYVLVRQEGRPRGIDARQVAVDSAEPLARELQDFLDSVRDRKPPRVDGVGARRSLETALRIAAAIGA